MKKIILVTGIAGFIGSRIATRFIDEGYHVIGVDDLSKGSEKNLPNKADFIEIDLSKWAGIQKLPKKCDYLLHLAGQSSGEASFDNPVRDLSKNTASTLNLIYYAIQKKVEKIIYSSSMAVYGDINKSKVLETNECSPLSCYAVSKLTSERYLYVFRKKIPFVTLRMSNVYGPGQNMSDLRQGMVSIYLAQALKSKKIIVKGNLNRTRDFIFIDDVVECWFKASISKKVSNDIINLGTGVSTKVSSLIRLIENEIKETTHKVVIGTKGDQQHIVANNSLLKKKLKIKKFIPLKTGLKIFISTLKQ